MPFDFTALLEEAKQKIAQVSDAAELEELRVKYLGRKGLLVEVTASIPALPVEARPEFGRQVNLLKNKLHQLLEEKAGQIEKKAPQEEGFDWTLPGVRAEVGTAHPLTQTIDEIASIFTRMGFVIVEGPEVETEYNNFTGLNIPMEHPSRDAFDTFYLKLASEPVSRLAGLTRKPANPQTGKLLLRSHTSPVQIRVMKAYKPPLAVIVPGKVYRPDATDAAHSYMFHQIEGFLVDEEVRFSDLKGVLSAFVKKLFGENVQMRFRPHFFPFTEPSAEVDISCFICRREQRTENREQKIEDSGKKRGEDSLNTEHRAPSTEHRKCSVCGGKGWLEVMGCGMIHPNVFANVGYPKGKYTGFAFGMGVDRIAMLKHGINDIRLFYENDLRFLRQF